MDLSVKRKEALSRARLGVDAIAAGKMIVVMDDLDRENEGDLICAAEFITTKDVAFMVRHTGGVLCAPATAERLHELELHSMVNNNRDPNNTAFTISVDYRIGTTTGISASDRAKTFRALANPNALKKDFTSPGHVFPLIYTKGGVLIRAGHTEASIDVCKLASLSPIAVISELTNDDGEPKRLKDCKEFCETYDIPLLCVKDIKLYIHHLYNTSAYHIAPPFSNQPIPMDLSASGEILEPLRSLVSHRLIIEGLAHRGQDTSWKATTRISLKREDILLNDTRVAIFKSLRTAQEHPVIIYGKPEGKEQVLVRVHSECLTGDLMGSTRCDCGDQLTAAYRKIQEAGMGIIIYVRGHEGRGISLVEKVRAYHLQNEEGLNTYEANHKLGFGSDIRRYDMIPEILEQLQVRSICLLSNNPRKISALGSVKIDSIEPHQVEATLDNVKYLLDKENLGGHRTNYSSTYF